MWMERLKMFRAQSRLLRGTRKTRATYLGNEELQLKYFIPVGRIIYTTYPEYH